MKRLYNEYLALNQDGKDLNTGAHIIAKDLLQICTNEDLDLRDAESVIVSSISVLFSEAVLRRAVKMRKKAGMTETEKEPEVDPIQQYYDLKAQHGWAGTIFCRCDAEDRLGRKMTAEEWEKVRSSYPWRKTIGDILCERGLEIIDSALYEAGLEREVDDG